MLFIKLITMVDFYKCMKFERQCMFSTPRTLRGVVREKLTSKIETAPLKGWKPKTREINKEGLALDLLLTSLGDEDKMNAACDLIKLLNLVDGYK